MAEEISSEYHYSNAEGDHTAGYLWPTVLRKLREEKAQTVFDLGCGNGSFVYKLNSEGMRAKGVDPSTEGVALAKKKDPRAPVEVGSGYDPLSERFGTFDAVVSLEVICCVYYPRKFVKCLYDLTKPGGLILVSTGYHGYWKNLMLAVCGAIDKHASPLWDHGIIKLWSVDTLTQLFHETDLRRESVSRLGRIPPLAKTMLLTFRKPS